MTDISDMELLKDYERNESDTAFAELVQRHINLVYSAALRQVGIAAQAEEITQAVFIILANKAAGLRADTILEGWLYETTQLTSLSFLRGERRRQFREQEAYMQSTLEEPADELLWNQLSPHLDEAMSHLGKMDRDAVVLRFFKEKSIREVATTLQVNEAAAQRRILRALEKLRKFFTKRGVVSTGTIIAGIISTHSIQAAPVALAQSVSVVAMAKGSIATASISTLVKGTMKTMTWLKLKFSLGVGIVAIIAAGAATVAISQTTGGSKSTSDQLSAQEIIKQSEEMYESLSSYSDEGKVVSTMGKTAMSPTTFTIKLARPNFYRIEWANQVHANYTNTGVVWSSGQGDFMVMGDRNPSKYSTKELALAGATGVSGSAAADIPGTFFKMNWGNQFGASSSRNKRSADEKIGDIDCYVLNNELKGHSTTIWIGKQDLLIHQVRTVSDSEAMKAVLAKAAETAKMTPSALSNQLKIDYTELTSIQTHENIVVNKKFSPTDFKR